MTMLEQWPIIYNILKHLPPIILVADYLIFTSKAHACPTINKLFLCMGQIFSFDS